MAFGIFLSFAPILNAQSTDSKPKKDITMIVTDLTPDQKIKLDEINKDYKTKIVTVKSDKSIQEEMKINNIKALRKQKREDISKVLTDKQKMEIKAYYQQLKTMHPTKKEGNKSPEERVKSRLEKMTVELALTEEQKPKVEAILTTFSTKRAEIMHNTQLSEEQKKSELQVVRKEQKQAIAKVLTPEQKEILKQKQSQRKAHKKETLKK